MQRRIHKDAPPDHHICRKGTLVSSISGFRPRQSKAAGNATDAPPSDSGEHEPRDPDDPRPDQAPTTVAAQTITLPELALATLISVAPVLIIFLFSQRFLVSGLTAGATKQ